ncbi:hypothetical protein M011DRAFT_467813 [Sporormia fimetaria CBS 119925]|uniref:Uncharacterized protein n=1 Tax=Sporormia fimetaria CBS 119925 TaxID=1340428 RepID=A0A6A6VC52_9PLEO|nr:hypothetical protein M011DRAFT_467813 [Sporormia fimetaria CBS 119925]
MSDVDGDSTMRSSPELGQSAERQTQAIDDPQTPRNPASHALSAGMELSPPNSQGPAGLSRDDTASGGSPSLNANGKRTLASTSAATSAAPHAKGRFTDPQTGYQWAAQEEAPGWLWKNPRALEEKTRAMDAIVDKDLMIKTKYGDPLDPNVAASG